MMTSRERFLAAVDKRPLERPPLWLMRQAGRYLPEYRALKEKHSFVEMVRTPDLAMEVTLQPLRRYALDAAILFSDILVIPEAMGQPYHFREQGGIGMEFTVSDRTAIEKLLVEGTAERLSYVEATLKKLRAELGESKALLGFCGSPWTVANYMVNGGSPPESEDNRLLALYREDRVLFGELMEKITAATAEYLVMQSKAGADAVQIFDSWAALCPKEEYQAMSLEWIRRLVEALDGMLPVILYAKGAGDRLGLLKQSGASVLSLDWTVDLAAVRRADPAGPAVQGNLNPDLLCGPVEATRRETRQLLEAMSSIDGFIFNLGHGMLPQAGVENVGALVEEVTSWKNR